MKQEQNTTKPVAIYKITNTLNGKVYVGQGVNPRDRFRQHCYGKNKNAAIHQAIVKYGKENFSFEILEWCLTKEESDAREIFYIAEFKSRVEGYNLTPGGKGTGIGPDNHMYGKKISEEQREKMLTAAAAVCKGRTLSDEHKKKLSIAGKGKPRTQKQIEAVRITGQNSKGRKASPETCAKLSAIRKGRKFTQEHRDNLRASITASWAKRKEAPL